MTKTDNGAEYPAAPECVILIDLRGIALSAGDGEETKRIPICMVGTFRKGKRVFTVTRKDIATASVNCAKSGIDTVLDYEHASEYPEMAAGGPVPAAGWITKIYPEVDADNVAWADVKLTARARELIGKDEIRYVSPYLDFGALDKATGKPQGLTITSAALTNRPVLDRMPAISLSEGWALSAQTGEQTDVKEKVMCSEHPKTALLCPQCDKNEISSLSASAHEHHGPKVIALSDVKRDGVGRLDIGAFSAGEVCSIEVVRALDQQRVALSEVDAAIASGKIKPALKEQFTKIALSDVENFRSLVKEMPAQVDLTERGHGGQGSVSDASELDKASFALSEATRAIVDRDKVSYATAFKRAQQENPEMVTRRNAAANRAQRVKGDE